MYILYVYSLCIFSMYILYVLIFLLLLLLTLFTLILYSYLKKYIKKGLPPLSFPFPRSPRFSRFASGIR